MILLLRCNLIAVGAIENMSTKDVDKFADNFWTERIFCCFQALSLFCLKIRRLFSALILKLKNFAFPQNTENINTFMKFAYQIREP